MDAEDIPARRGAGDPLDLLAGQDLDSLSVAELARRLEALHAEIARTERKIKQSVNHKASAEALFRK